MSATSIVASRGRLQSADASTAAGLLMLAALWLGPLVPWARSAFSAHMLLHLGVVVVAAPLIGFGLARRLPRLRGFGAALSWGSLAATFEMIAVWGWHLPLLHDAAEGNTALFVVEQSSFLIAGLGVWTVAFAARSREAAGAAAMAQFFTFAHMTMFGLILTLIPRLIYDPDICRGAFGLDRLDDQHLGGVLMATGGGLPYLAGTIYACSLVLRSRTVMSRSVGPGR